MVQKSILGVEQERLGVLADGKHSKLESCVLLLYEANRECAFWIQLSEGALLYNRTTANGIVKITDGCLDRYLVEVASLEINSVNYILRADRVWSVRRDAEL